MAGNPLINSMTKKQGQGDPRFGRFGAGGQAQQGQQVYGSRPTVSRSMVSLSRPMVSPSTASRSRNTVSRLMARLSTVSRSIPTTVLRLIPSRPTLSQFRPVSV